VVGALVIASTGVRSHRLGATSHAGWWVLLGCGVAVLVLGLVVTSAWARASAVRTARESNPEFLEAAPA
jgi:hypothetical protein